MMKNYIDKFYKYMYKPKRIYREMPSGRLFCIEYYRTPFWAYEKQTLWLFLKDKIRTWHGCAWLIYPNGNKMLCGAYCKRTYFPKRLMGRMLIDISVHIDKILENK